MPELRSKFAGGAKEDVETCEILGESHDKEEEVKQQSFLKTEKEMLDTDLFSTQNPGGPEEEAKEDPGLPRVSWKSLRERAPGNLATGSSLGKLLNFMVRSSHKTHGHTHYHNVSKEGEKKVFPRSVGFPRSAPLLRRRHRHPHRDWPGNMKHI